MADNEVELQVRVGGLGDVEGDERTISTEAAERISDIVSSDLRERYADIKDSDELAVVCVNAPNVAIVKMGEGKE